MKLKLTKENLDIFSLMQHIVLININSYRSLKKENQDFSNEEVQNNFDLLCTNYINIHKSFSIFGWKSYYRDLQFPTINKYIVRSNKDLAFHLIIDLEQDHYTCSKVGLQTTDRIFEPTQINLFNIQFEYGE